MTPVESDPRGTLNRLIDYHVQMNATPAAPKGGVVVARELAEKVQDALGRFVDNEGWCGADMETADAFSAALAQQEPRHDALADGEAASA